VEWQDEPWPERVQECLKELWKEIKTTRRCEATANEALIDSIHCNDVANNARVELQEEVNRTSVLLSASVRFTTGRLLSQLLTSASSCTSSTVSLE